MHLVLLTRIGESGKPRGVGGPGCNTEPAGPAGPVSTRDRGTAGGPGKLVAPVAPASPRNPGGPSGPENSVDFHNFHYCNSNTGITSYRALGHVASLLLVHAH